MHIFSNQYLLWYSVRWVHAVNRCEWKYTNKHIKMRQNAKKKYFPWVWFATQTWRCEPIERKLQFRSKKWSHNMVRLLQNFITKYSQTIAKLHQKIWSNYCWTLYIKLLQNLVKPLQCNALPHVFFLQKKKLTTVALSMSWSNRKLCLSYFMEFLSYEIYLFYCLVFPISVLSRHNDKIQSIKTAYLSLQTHQNWCQKHNLL